MEKFVVDREKHLTGEVLEVLENYGFMSCLHEEVTGLQCCLGQYGQAKGVPVPALTNQSSPQELHEMYQDAFPEKLLVDDEEGKRDSGLSIDIQAANDRKGISQEERERELTKLFSKLDIELSFIGDSRVAVQRALDYVSQKEDTTLVA